jgi:hypothetical protein
MVFWRKSKLKANVWRITGYRGNNDYDGLADDNTKLDIIFDSRLKKEDVENILFYYWGKKYRSVAIKAELIKEDK